MTEENYHVGLPKWPEIRVQGKSIDMELAAEIIVRTCCSRRSRYAELHTL